MTAWVQAITHMSYQGLNNDVIMETVKEEMDIDMREEDLDQAHHFGNLNVCKKVNQGP